MQKYKLWALVLVLGLAVIWQPVQLAFAQLGTWESGIIDNNGNAGFDTSLAVINGEPAISYYENVGTELRYASFNGTDWDLFLIDGDNNDTTPIDAGQYSSLAVVDGQPAISYYDATNTALRYARFDGTTWNISIIDGEDNAMTPIDAGQYSSLAVVDGQPAISYYDATNADLRYARFDGATWNISIIDETDTVGEFSSLAVVDGQPAISYLAGTDGDLKYARFDGSAWVIEVVDAAGFVGPHTSLSVIAGQPAISYFDDSNKDLKYARFDGTDWTTETVDGPDIVGRDTSLTEVDGQPAISYFSNTDTNLKYARFNGTDWNIELVDEPGNVGRDSSIAVVDGQPAISYLDATNSALKFAIFEPSAETITVEFNAANSSNEEGQGIGDVLSVTTSDGQPTPVEVAVGIEVTGGSADTDDYDLTGTVTIPANTASGSTISVASGITITDDMTLEQDETLSLLLSNPTNVEIGAQSSYTFTIENDDAAAVTIEDVTGAEDETLEFTATLDNPVAGGFEVTYSIANVETDSNDFSGSTTGTLTFEGTAGETETITVELNDDTDIEGDETFTVSLTGSTVAGVDVSDTATGTITDNEAASLTVEDVSEPEGDTLTFTVTLDNAVTGGFDVDIAVTNNTTETEDFVGAALPSDTLSFAGTANETQTFEVPTTEDTLPSQDETFTVTLSNATSANVTATDTATGTITNDDAGIVLDVTNDGRITPADAVFVFNRVGNDLGDSDDDENDALADVDNSGAIDETDVTQVIASLGTVTD